MTATITVLVHSMYDACLCSIGICSGHLMIQSPRLPFIHVPPSSQMYSIFCVRTSSPIHRVQNCTFLVINTTTKLSAGNQNFMHNCQQANGMPWLTMMFKGSDQGENFETFINRHQPCFLFCRYL